MDCGSSDGESARSLVEELPEHRGICLVLEDIVQEYVPVARILGGIAEDVVLLSVVDHIKTRNCLAGAAVSVRQNIGQREIHAGNVSCIDPAAYLAYDILRDVLCHLGGNTHNTTCLEVLVVDMPK